MVKYVKPTISYGMPKRKQKAVPDQSLSLTEIVERFTRQLPVNVGLYDPVYIDQQEVDMEAFKRSDFSEKAEMAANLKQRNSAEEKRLMDEEDERMRRIDEEKAAKKARIAAKKAAGKSEPGEGSGLA